MDVYSLKTRTDAFIWLAHMEGDLLSIRASVNAGLYPLTTRRLKSLSLNVRYLTVVLPAVNF